MIYTYSLLKSNKRLRGPWDQNTKVVIQSAPLNKHMGKILETGRTQFDNT